jgi:hypothetical protein
MTPAVPRISALLGSILALAACGITASPSTSAQASATNEAVSQAPEIPAVLCEPAPIPFDPTDFDLTGAWAGDDGGIYYLRQLESVVWWNGMSGRDRSPLDLGRDWNNVARGVITGLQIDVEGSDVARGGALGNGKLVLKVQADGKGNIQIVKVGDEWGAGNEFGSTVWTPCSPVELQVADYVGTYGGSVPQYVDILAVQACDDLAAMKDKVTAPLHTAEAGSPEFRAALGYSNAISDRELELNC